MTSDATQPSSAIGADRLAAVLLGPVAQPWPPVEAWASVAAVFRSGERDTELLFIERARREGDPWSGQMAFPGGRASDGDADSFFTAERETREELALDLVGVARLGSLGDVLGGHGSHRPVTVSGHCYWLHGPRPELVANHEVADAVWVELSALLDPNRHIDYRYPPSGGSFPGIQLDAQQQVIWGLTLRFLTDLFTRLDRPFIGESGEG